MFQARPAAQSSRCLKIEILRPLQSMPRASAAAPYSLQWQMIQIIGSVVVVGCVVVVACIVVVVSHDPTDGSDCDAYESTVW